MFLLIRSELIDMTATEFSSTSLKKTHCVQAVKGGFEPPCCDSVVDKIAGFVVNPYPITYFKFSAHETSGCVCHADLAFTT